MSILVYAVTNVIILTMCYTLYSCIICFKVLFCELELQFSDKLKVFIFLRKRKTRMTLIFVNKNNKLDPKDVDYKLTTT